MRISHIKCKKLSLYFILKPLYSEIGKMTRYDEMTRAIVSPGLLSVGAGLFLIFSGFIEPYGEKMYSRYIGL
jgi:hypothetical protein